MPFSRKHKIGLILLLVLGVFAQGLPMWRSGLRYDFGLGFWGANGHDGIWHLALINQVLRSFPPPHPTLAGFRLANYHYFFDLLLAVVNKLTTIPIRYLYFQIFPLLLSLSLGILSFLVGYRWQKDYWVGFWLAFLNYFAGSFGYWITLWREGKLGGSSLFWAMQPVSSLINPPFALSLVVLLLGLLCLLRVKKWTFKKIFGVGLLFGCLINIKAYAGIVGLAGLATFSMVKFLRKKKTYSFIWGLSFLISLLIFIPINRGAQSLFILKPFWFIHSMIESPDRLYLPRLALARYFLVEKGIGPRLVAIELIGLGLFLLGNLGTRMIGAGDLVIRFWKKKINDIDYFLLTGAIVGFLPPLVWVQKGTAWNTIQFFYYFLFFANFYLAATLSRLTRWQSHLKVPFLGLLIVLTIPTTIANFRDYSGWPPPASLPEEEREALVFLEKQEPGIVLTYPYNKYARDSYRETPFPLRIYESTAYVSAFSGKQTFLEDEVNLSISAYDWEARRKEVETFFASETGFVARGFLLNNQIDYLYLVEGQNFLLSEDDLGIDQIFGNGEVRIYRVRGKIE